MPTYEFECAKCRRRFDEVRPIANRNDPAQCKCGAIAVRGIFTAPMGQPDIRPYIAVAGDRAGKPITSRREHREFLARNGLHEAADKKLPAGRLPFVPPPKTREYVIERRETIRRVLRQRVPLATLRRTT